MNFLGFQFFLEFNFRNTQIFDESFKFSFSSPSSSFLLTPFKLAKSLKISSKLFSLVSGIKRNNQTKLITLTIINGMKIPTPICCCNGLKNMLKMYPLDQFATQPMIPAEPRVLWSKKLGVINPWNWSRSDGETNNISRNRGVGKAD